MLTEHPPVPILVAAQFSVPSAICNLRIVRLFRLAVLIHLGGLSGVRSHSSFSRLVNCSRHHTFFLTGKCRFHQRRREDLVGEALRVYLVRGRASGFAFVHGKFSIRGPGAVCRGELEPIYPPPLNIFQHILRNRTSSDLFELRMCWIYSCQTSCAVMTTRVIDHSSLDIPEYMVIMTA